MATSEPKMAGPLLQVHDQKDASRHPVAPAMLRNNQVHIQRAANATAPDVISIKHAALVFEGTCHGTAQAAPPQEQLPVTYHNTGINTQPLSPTHFESIYGRPYTRQDVCSANRTRFMTPLEPHELEYGSMFLAPSTGSSSKERKYADSGFQTDDFMARKKAITKAKVKASMLVKKYKDVAMKEGWTVWAEGKEERVIHSEQVQMKIQLDPQGNVIGETKEGVHLPNIWRKEFVPEKVILRPIPALEPSLRESDREPEPIEDYGLETQYENNGDADVDSAYDSADQEDDARPAKRVKRSDYVDSSEFVIYDAAKYPVSPPTASTPTPQPAKPLSPAAPPRLALPKRPNTPPRPSASLPPRRDGFKIQKANPQMRRGGSRLLQNINRHLQITSGIQDTSLRTESTPRTPRHREPPSQPQNLPQPRAEGFSPRSTRLLNSESQPQNPPASSHPDTPSLKRKAASTCRQIESQREAQTQLNTGTPTPPPPKAQPQPSNSAPTPAPTRAPANPLKRPRSPTASIPSKVPIPAPAPDRIPSQTANLHLPSIRAQPPATAHIPPSISTRIPSPDRTRAQSPPPARPLAPAPARMRNPSPTQPAFAVPSLPPTSTLTAARKPEAAPALAPTSITKPEPAQRPKRETKPRPIRKPRQDIQPYIPRAMREARRASETGPLTPTATITKTRTRENPGTQDAERTEMGRGKKRRADDGQENDEDGGRPTKKERISTDERAGAIKQDKDGKWRRGGRWCG